MATIALPYEARRYLRNINWPLIIMGVALSLFGVIAIQSADLHSAGAASEYKKQIFYTIVGIGAMYLFSRIDYRQFERWAPGLYVANVLLLAFVLKGGHHAL